MLSFCFNLAIASRHFYKPTTSCHRRSRLSLFRITCFIAMHFTKYPLQGTSSHYNVFFHYVLTQHGSNTQHKRTTPHHIDNFKTINIRTVPSYLCFSLHHTMSTSSSSRSLSPFASFLQSTAQTTDIISSLPAMLTIQIIDMRSYARSSVSIIKVMKTAAWGTKV